MTSTTNIFVLDTSLKSYSIVSAADRPETPNSAEIARMIVDLVARKKGGVALRHLKEGMSLEARFGVVQRIKDGLETSGEKPSTALITFLDEALPTTDIARLLARSYQNKDAAKSGGGERIRLLYNNSLG